jgi:hypothetical protein
MNYNKINLTKETADQPKKYITILIRNADTIKDELNKSIPQWFAARK